MSARNTLKLLCGLIFLALLAYSIWASTRQPVWDWQGLTRGEDRWWTIATIMDAYCGFLIFYVWVVFKERGALARSGWFLAIMLLGNMATSVYLLIQLARLDPEQPVSSILWRSHG
jgi:Protein of unknown function (DUF1475)